MNAYINIYTTLYITIHIWPSMQTFPRKQQTVFILQLIYEIDSDLVFMETFGEEEVAVTEHI